MKRVILLALLALCGCATTPPPVPEPIITTVEVKVPVTVPCVPDGYNKKAPAYVDSDPALKAAADAAERYQLLWGGRAQRIARERENEAALAGCLK
jgi:hypothetical protein